MARQSRTSTRHLELLEQLRSEPYSFDFYQAIRLLDCANASTPQTGRSETPKDDPLRLSQAPSLAFAPSTVSEFEQQTGHVDRLVQQFFGMFGPQGALPLHLTDYARQRIRHHDDHTFHRFVDIFHHRMLSLFYRAWSGVRPTVNFDRGVRDRFGEYVASMFGTGMESLTGRDALPDLPKRHFAGILGSQTRHADGLLAMLKGYYGLPVELEQLVGQWIALPDDSLCQVGVNPAISTLGETMTIGTHIWDCQQKFRIEFGPLKLDEFFHLLPVPVRVFDERDVLMMAPSADDPPIPEDDVTAAEDLSTYDGPYADTVYFNGQVFASRDGHQQWADAVASYNGNAIAVGSLGEIHHVLNDETIAVDLHGALVLPDLELDPSGHTTTGGGTTPIRAHLAPEPDQDIQKLIVAAVGETAKQVPVGTWIHLLGVKTNEPIPAWLDSLNGISPDHPLLIELQDESDQQRIVVNALGVSELIEHLPNNTTIAASSPPTSSDSDPISDTSAPEDTSSTESTFNDLSVTSGTDGATMLVGSTAIAAIEAVSKGQLPACEPVNANTKSLCGMSPNVADKWYLLETKLREKIRSAATPDSDTSRRKSVQKEIRMACFSELIREISASTLVTGEDPASSSPANMLVVSKDLFGLVENDAISELRDTRTIMAIRRGDVVYDLLAKQGEKESVTFGDIRSNLLLSHPELRLSANESQPTADQTNTPSDSEPSSRASLDSLIAMVRSYVGDQLKWDVRLILKGEETPPIALGVQGHLGWSTWLLRDQIQRDPDDLIIDAMESIVTNPEAFDYLRTTHWNHQVVGQTKDGQLLMAQN